MSYVHFVLVCEGSTDEALVDHLERLLIWVGAREVSGVPLDVSRLVESIGRDVGSKVEAAVKLEPGANLVFVHRDADNADPTPRLSEIRMAFEGRLEGRAGVPIVPVQETEAWLLLDEQEIRRVAGKPSGRAPLDLPSLSEIERVSSPKEVLEEAILVASELSGRRRMRLRSRLPRLKSQLLRRLPVGGRIQHLPAWARLREETRVTVERI